MRPPAWVVAAVVAVYPEGVRERYGPEIADLLRTSPRPWRDLGNVAWIATLERTGSVRVGLLRPYVLQMLTLGILPGVFWYATMLLSPAGSALSGALGALVGRGHIRYSSTDGLQMGGDSGVFLIGEVVVVVAVAVLASLSVRWLVDLVAVPAPAFLVPTLLGLGCLGLAVAPPGLNLLMERGTWVAVPTTVVCWWVMVLVLGSRFRTLLGQGRTTAARVLAVAGTLAVTAVTFAVNLATLTGPQHLSELRYTGPTGLSSIAAVCTPFAFAVLARVTPPALAARGGQPA